MKQPLFRLLSKKGMFPPDSSAHAILRSHYGEGYKALKQILFPCHPVYHVQPAVLIAEYPCQKEMSIVDYHSLFLDYLQLRAIIMDYHSSLDNENELDLFILRTKHGVFLNRVTRDQRLRHSFEPLTVLH